MSNDLIWWFHRRSGIAMFPPAGCTTTSVLGGMQGGVDSHKPAQKHSFPESLSLAMREKHKSKREPGWEQSKEPEVSSNIRNHSENTAKTRCLFGFWCCPCQISLWKQDILAWRMKARQCLIPPRAPRTYTATFPFCEEVCFLSLAL